MRMRGWRALWLAMLCLTLGAQGCGSASSDDRPTQTPSASAETPTTVYFLAPGGETPIGVSRSIAAISPYARGAAEALLAGPTEAERRQGIASALPAGARLLNLAIADSTSATIDISGLPSGPDAIPNAKIITQVVRSLVGVSGIEEVTFRSDGEPWGMPLMEGGVYDGPYGYPQLLGWVGLCTTSDLPGAADGDCFRALP